jgi:hypothetical protein
MKPLPRILLIFQLDDVLCRRNLKTSESLKQMLNPNTIQIKPDILDFTHFLFIRNRLFIKVGVWNFSSPETTESLTKKVFSDYHRHLLFKYSSSPGEVDLQRVWLNYPEFNKTNTAFISTSSKNLKQPENFLPFPEYKTDNSLMLFQEYLRFFSLQFGENRIGDLEKFLLRVKFVEYYAEKSKTSGNMPQGEASRFW